ncbi:MAG: hypothetical protein R3C61_04450 [Bacteroidia bacterium]
MTQIKDKAESQPPLKILLLEKNSGQPVSHYLKTLPFPATLVVAGEKYEFLSQLINYSPDIVLLKDEVAGFPIREAFFFVRETHPWIPVFGIKGGSVIISEAPGPGTPSDINWIQPQQITAHLSQIRMQKNQPAPDQLAHARLRVVKQIKTNISGLENIRAFLKASDSGTNDWMEEVSHEIEKSIDYLCRLQENLSLHAHSDVRR